MKLPLKNCISACVVVTDEEKNPHYQVVVLVVVVDVLIRKKMDKTRCWQKRGRPAQLLIEFLNESLNKIYFIADLLVAIIN